MRKLLSAEFSRMRKDKVFWLGVIFMFGFGLFVVYTQYSDIVRYGEHRHFDDVLFSYVLFMGCCSAVFCSMFTGTEYSDGTVRNKLVVGHLRSSIYLSNWVTSTVAAMIMAVVFLVSYCSLGSFLLEAPKASAGQIVFHLFLSIFTIMAFSSLFSMLSMLITRKSASAVVCLLVFLGLLMMAMVVKAKLDAPEFVSDYIMTVNGVEMTEPRPNPKFLQPGERKVYQYFLDLLPTGQGLQLSAFEVPNPLWIMANSVLISVVTTVSGIFAFRKKNLK